MPDITTTRNGPNGGLQTTTPGQAMPSIVPPNMGGLDAFLLDLARRRVAAAQAAPAASPASVPRVNRVPTMGAGGYGGGEDRGYARDPHEGWSKAPEQYVTRTVSDPRVSQYHKMATGFDAPSVQERFIPGVGWEFNNGGGRGEGSGGGFEGGGMSNPSELHSTPNLQAKMGGAGRTGSPANDMDTDSRGADQQQAQATGSAGMPQPRRAPILPTVRPAVSGRRLG